MCNTIPEDENGVQIDINNLKTVDIEYLKVEHDYQKSLASAYKNATEKLGKRFDDSLVRIKELEDGLRYIAKDMAALETDCAHDQCDAYVMKAKDLLGYTR